MHIATGAGEIARHGKQRGGRGNAQQQAEQEGRHPGVELWAGPMCHHQCSSIHKNKMVYSLPLGHEVMLPSLSLLSCEPLMMAPTSRYPPLSAGCPK